MAENLFSEAKLGNFTLANRMVMAPMTRSRARSDGVPGELTATYYAQRASAGLIITEAINISADALGSPFTPGIFNDAQVQAWKHVTAAVHDAGGRIFAQLWHTGRVGHSAVRDGKIPVAPSAISITGQQHFTPIGMLDYEVPRELTTAEVRSTIADYAHAAALAKEANFDGIELHAAFGYLPNQFLVDSANHRTDEYGGSIANRCRFVLEVMQAFMKIWHHEQVGIKLSPVIPFNNMIDSDPETLYIHLFKALDALHPGYIHLMNALYPLDAFPHWPKDVLATFRPFINNTIIANGGYDAEKAQAELAAGRADLISFGTLFIANPDLPLRFKMSAALAETDRATMYGGGAHGYTDYPKLQTAHAN